MIHRKTFHLRLRSELLRLGERTLVMGVLNVTPDSFRWRSLPSREERRAAGAGDQHQGADIIDIGAAPVGRVRQKF
jgi:dihydropteroate synthase